LSSGIDGAFIRDVLIGGGVLLAGVAILIPCLALARLLRRLNGTLDELDRQIGALSAPVVDVLAHVGGIADTADSTVARLSTVVGALENVAGATSRTAQLASDAVAPALVNVGATLTGVSAGMRRLVTGRRGSAPGGDSSGG